MRRFVDLSIFLENHPYSDPPIYRPKINYINHKQTVAEAIAFFSGMKASDLLAIIADATTQLGGEHDGTLVLLNEASAFPHGSIKKMGRTISWPGQEIFPLPGFRVFDNGN